MTEEKLNKAQQLHDIIATKKAYLNMLKTIIGDPWPIRQEIKRNGSPGAFFVIPAEVVQVEALCQVDKLNKEIECLEKEFETL